MIKFYRKGRKQQGFSLVELMIVIAVIALIVAVGIPAWTIMIRAGNENSALQTLDRVRMLQSQYAGAHQGNFASFDDLIKSSGLDERFKGEKPVINGYVYTIEITPKSANQPAFYKVNADPQVREGVQATGSRSFYTDSSLSTIKQNDNQKAGPADPSV
jgi:prepilin-type N-terminal cleavage/methylation domain-containing protein